VVNSFANTKSGQDEKSGEGNMMQRLYYFFKKDFSLALSG
jgi:hypothetical protein